MNREKIKTVKGAGAAALGSIMTLFAAHAYAQDTQNGQTEPNTDGSYTIVEPDEENVVSPFVWRLSDEEKRQIEQGLRDAYPEPEYRYNFNSGIDTPFDNGCSIEDRLRGNLVNFHEGRNHRLGLSADPERLLRFEFRWGSERDPFESDRRCHQTSRFGMTGSLIEGLNAIGDGPNPD